MDFRKLSVCVVEPNRFEGQLIVDLLRNAGVVQYKLCVDPAAAVSWLEANGAHVVISCVEMTPMDGPTWVRAFRRNHRLGDTRKSAIFLTSRAFSRSVAEDCRHAGANALIGKPLSGKILLATITKVLSAPRPFIDAAGYTGPCRRAGIVTAGPAKRRRQADDTVKAEDAAATIPARARSA